MRRLSRVYRMRPGRLRFSATARAPRFDLPGSRSSGCAPVARDDLWQRCQVAQDELRRPGAGQPILPGAVDPDRPQAGGARAGDVPLERVADEERLLGQAAALAHPLEKDLGLRLDPADFGRYQDRLEQRREPAMVELLALEIRGPIGHESDLEGVPRTAQDQEPLENAGGFGEEDVPRAPRAGVTGREALGRARLRHTKSFQKRAPDALSQLHGAGRRQGSRA